MKRKRAWIPERVIQENRRRAWRLEAEIREIIEPIGKELFEVRYIKRINPSSSERAPESAIQINRFVYRLRILAKQSGSFELPYGWTWAD